MSELTVGSISGLSSNGFVIDVASGSKIVQPGAVLQVVQAVKTDPSSFSVATGGFSTAAISATITPTATTSKILVVVHASVDGNTGAIQGTLFRNGSATTYVGDAEGSRRRVSTSTRNVGNDNNSSHLTFDFLDSPASTSAQTYDVRLGHAQADTRTLYINRSDFNQNGAVDSRQASSITLMEIAG
jgi:hypothetical protein